MGITDLHSLKSLNWTMKTYPSTLIFILACGFAKSQTKVTAKEVVNNVGKEVTLCDSVYSARAMNNVGLFNIGGKFPKEIITMVVFKSDRAKFKKSLWNFMATSVSAQPER